MPDPILRTDCMARPAVDAIARISYEGGESDEAGRAWVAGLTSHLDAYVATLQPLLTRRNYDGLVSLILTDIANSTPPPSTHLCPLSHCVWHCKAH